MPYIVGRGTNPPHFVGGELLDFHEKVPSLEHRSDVVRAFKDGTRLLRPDEMPTRLLLDRPTKNFRDIFRSQDGILIVSPELHDLLEQIDPTVHQFSSIVLEHMPMAGLRYCLNVHAKHDSIIDEKSNVRRNAGMPDNNNVMHVNFVPEGADITIDSSQLASTNLWRERRYPGSLLVSDKLYSEIKNRGIKFFPLIRIKEI
jgi:hypothetical protein